jgi:uncharacterized membrane protein
MTAAFFRAVLLGTVALASLPVLLFTIDALSSPWRAPDASPLYVTLGGTIAISFVIVLVATVVIGIPARLILRYLKLESTPAYIAVGAVVGAAAAMPLASPWTDSSIWIIAYMGACGAATGYVWGHSQSLAVPDSRPARDMCPYDTPRSHVLQAQYRLPAWPPAAIPSGDISIRPVVLVMTLVALGFAITVAAAGEGRFDRLPSQQYFPASLREPTAAACAGSTAAQVTYLPGIEPFQAEWYATHLRAAQEKPLYRVSLDAASGVVRTYRFTWLRSFHNPVVVRIEELGDGAMRLTAKRLSGYGGYGPGRIEARVVRTLTHAEVAKLQRTLSTSRPLELPVRDCGPGPDGSNWIVEANEAGRYRYIYRWTPEHGPIRDLGLLFLNFTGWSFKDVY